MSTGVKNRKGRVGIVYPWPNLDTVPSLCNASSLLAQWGYEVDIFTYTSDDFRVPTFKDGINLVVWRHLPSTPRILQRLGRHVHRWEGGILSLLLRLYRELKDRLRQASAYIGAIRHGQRIRQRHGENPYCCIIGIDPEGLVQAHMLAKSFNTPLVYYSLELLLSHELNSSIERRLKQREITSSHEAAFIIIQDENRARLIAEDNQISNDQFVLVPNAPLGPARRRLSNYWHEQFDIPSDLQVVLHTGSVEEWTGIREIVQSVKTWPESWVLVVHTRYQGEASNDVAELRKLALPGRVVFSLNPVPRQEYETLVDGADIGIAFYVPQAGSTYTQLNIQTIGLASGKIAYYLRAGLPVIVNETTTMSELVQREGCGISIEEGRDIGNAIARITNNYDKYSRGACQAFNKNFDFEHKFEEVINRLDSLQRKHD